MQLTAPELKQVLDALTEPEFADVRSKLWRQLTKRQQETLDRTRVERVPCERCGKLVTKTRWAGYRSHYCPHQQLCAPSSRSRGPACAECQERVRETS
jgi:formamidopyrimidine-DNA glycosylase